MELKDNTIVESLFNNDGTGSPIKLKFWGSILGNETVWNGFNNFWATTGQNFNDGLSIVTGTEKARVISEASASVLQNIVKFAIIIFSGVAVVYIFSFAVKKFTRKKYRK